MGAVRGEFLESWRPGLLKRIERGAVYEDLQHDVALGFGFLSVLSPNRELFFRGDLRGGVGDAGAHPGDRHHRPERSALPALLPRSSGETQLPQRAHLHLVGQGFRFRASASELQGFSFRARALLCSLNSVRTGNKVSLYMTFSLIPTSSVRLIRAARCGSKNHIAVHDTLSSRYTILHSQKWR